MAIGKRALIVGLLSALGIILLIQWISYRATQQLVETSEAVAASSRLLFSLEEIVTKVQDAQRGQRGFVITGDESYLEPFHYGNDRIPQEIADLRQLTSDEPLLQHQLQQLEILINSARAQFRQIVDARRNSGFRAAQTEVLSGKGKQAMDDIRRLATQMKSQVQASLEERERAARTAAARVPPLMLAGTLVSFSLLLAVFYLLNREVAQRRAAEEAVARHARELNRYFTVSLDLFCIAGYDGYFKRLNPAWAKALGHSEEELLSRPYLDFVHPDDLEATRAEAQKLAAGADTISFENRYRRQDGSYRWLLWKSTPDPAQQLIYASARDITDRKQAEQALQDLNRELEAFTYSVSHDLRAPLRHIDGFSQMLSEDFGPQLPEDARRYLDRIRSGTRQMGQLVDDLLNLARVGRQELRLQVTGLSSLVEEVQRELSPETAGRQVQWDIRPLPFVECDPALMKQVFANLLSNALKYTRPRNPAVIEVGVQQENGLPVIHVRDNGVGFSMKYAHKLFGVFQRLHRPEDFEGTGVGLATVQRILRKHSGRIWAEAELDKGATFYFSLGPVSENVPLPDPNSAR